MTNLPSAKCSTLSVNLQIFSECSITNYSLPLSLTSFLALGVSTHQQRRASGREPVVKRAGLTAQEVPLVTAPAAPHSPSLVRPRRLTWKATMRSTKSRLFTSRCASEINRLIEIKVHNQIQFVS